MNEEPGYAPRTAQLVARLRRIEGQVRGLQRLVEEQTYCIDVLTQVSSTTRALEALAIELVRDHLSHCVAAAAGDPTQSRERVDEAVVAIARLVRS